MRRSTRETATSSICAIVTRPWSWVVAGLSVRRLSRLDHHGQIRSSIGRSDRLDIECQVVRFEQHGDRPDGRPDGRSARPGASWSVPGTTLSESLYSEG